VVAPGHEVVAAVDSGVPTRLAGDCFLATGWFLMLALSLFFESLFVSPFEVFFVLFFGSSFSVARLVSFFPATGFWAAVLAATLGAPFAATFDGCEPGVDKADRSFVAAADP
jgi:hypothetical protein